MKSAASKAAGLLGALREFSEREAILLRVGDYEGFSAIRRREAPLIARLCELASRVDTQGLMGRLGELLERRRQNLALLQGRAEHLRSESLRLSARRERLRLVSPYLRSQGKRGQAVTC
jgi:hypothetical protein